MTVADFLDCVDYGTQLVCIRNRQKYFYFQGMVDDLRKSRVKMGMVKDFSVLGINTTTSHGEAWIVITVAED